MRVRRGDRYCWTKICSVTESPQVPNPVMYADWTGHMMGSENTYETPPSSSEPSDTASSPAADFTTTTGEYSGFPGVGSERVMYSSGLAGPIAIMHARHVTET